MATEHNNPFKKFKKAGAAKLGGEAVHALMKRKAAHKNANWIQGAIKKPGALHKELGIKEGTKIPAKTLTRAAGKSGKLGQRARLAETLKGLKHKKSGRKEPTIGSKDIEKKSAKKMKHMKRKGVIGMTGDVEMKTAKRHKHSEKAIKGLEKFAKEESKEKKSKKHKHAEKDATCMKCKAAHEKHSGKE